MKRGLLFLSFSIFVAPAVARADLPVPRLVPELTLKDKNQDSAVTEPDPWSSRPRGVNISGGPSGGPLGYGGLSFEYAPTRYTVFEVGAGVAPHGPAGAFMPRLRLPLNRIFAVGFGLPFSMRPYEYVAQAAEQCPLVGCQTGFRTVRSWDIAFWGHIQPNLEIRVAPMLALRLYGGYSMVLNDKADRCTSTLAGGCPSQLGETMWYGGFGLGYAW
jgi:hypothetical protein